MSIDTHDTRRSSRTRTSPTTGAARRPAETRTASSPSAATHTALIRAGVVETPDHEALALERIAPSLVRVRRDGRTIGFVEHVGRVYVALAGEYYDRAVEVAQTLDVSHAARALA
ncbi:hypothetical protein [Labedella endophytica]|uniref:Uncharacterized protein n=1 Tax=Labedella endophytica TaxID=1523160 RepID=A0A3S0VIG9_9MICO|nr:hypothetical protein [Labedella endophytica]RUR03300.1 hypothetical protein ELQ94_01755 [Labedella endophytica]